MSRANGADLNLDGVRGEGREIATAGEPGRRSKPTSEDTRHPVCAECGSAIASRRSNEPLGAAKNVQEQAPTLLLDCM